MEANGDKQRCTNNKYPWMGCSRLIKYTFNNIIVPLAIILLKFETLSVDLKSDAKKKKKSAKFELQIRKIAREYLTLPRLIAGNSVIKGVSFLFIPCDSHPRIYIVNYHFFSLTIPSIFLQNENKRRRRQLL